MFKATYISSSDPIRDILSTDFQRLVKRPFGGYVIFLFGASDESFLKTFYDSLISLDSLTGDKIAGFVFAKEVQIRAEVSTIFGFHQDSFIEKDTVRLESVNRKTVIEPMVKNYRQASRNERIVTAITYSTDELAEYFGVFAELPCMVVLDAVPTKKVEALPLAGMDKEGLISVFRHIRAKFHPNEMIDCLQSLIKQITDVESRIAQCNYDLSATEREKKVKVDEVRKAYQMKVQATMKEKSRLQRTAENLTRYANLGDTRMVDIVRHKYAESLLSKKIAFGQIDSIKEIVFELNRRIILLQSELRNNEEECLSKVAIVEEFYRDRLSIIGTSIEAFEKQRHLLTREIAKVEIVSLQKIAKSVFSDRKLVSVTKDVKERAFSLFGEFLKPDTILKLLNLGA